MKLGMGSFAYRWAIGRPYYRPKDPMDVHALIDQCVRFKLHAVLLCNNIELHTLSDAQILEIKEHLDKEKIDVEVGARGVDQEYFKRMLEICHLLGAKVLRVGWDMDRTTNLDKQVQNGIETMKKLMQIANAYGVEIGIENTKVITIQEVKAIIEGVNDPHFGAVIDTCNSTCFITPTEEVVSTLAPYAKQVHIKDYIVKLDPSGDIIYGVPLGQGMVNFNKVKEILDQAGFNGHAFLELYIDRKETHEQTIQYEQDCVAQSVAYARDVLHLQ